MPQEATVRPLSSSVGRSSKPANSIRTKRSWPQSQPLLCSPRGAPCHARAESGRPSTASSPPGTLFTPRPSNTMPPQSPATRSPTGMAEVKITGASALPRALIRPLRVTMSVPGRRRSPCVRSRLPRTPRTSVPPSMVSVGRSAASTSGPSGPTNTGPSST